MAFVSIIFFVFLVVARGYYRLVSISFLESGSAGWLGGSSDSQRCDSLDRMRVDWIDTVVSATGLSGRSIALEWTRF